MKNSNSIIEEFLVVIKSTKNLSDKTIVAYRSDLTDFMKSVNIENIDDNTILFYIQELAQARFLKDSTIHRKLIVLKMFFEYAHSQNYLDKNYFLSHTFKLKK